MRHFYCLQIDQILVHNIHKFLRKHRRLSGFAEEDHVLQGCICEVLRSLSVLWHKFFHRIHDASLCHEVFLRHHKVRVRCFFGQCGTNCLRDNAPNVNIILKTPLPKLFDNPSPLPSAWNLSFLDYREIITKIFPGWPDMQIILCTINCHTKKQPMVIKLVSCFFFYGHTIENLSAINLYGQLLTLMLFCMVIQWFSCFSWNPFFWTNNFQFLIYIVPSNSKVLKLSRPKEKASQQLSEFKVPRFCKERKTYTSVVFCPTLHHCRLYFLGMRFHKILFLVLGNQKWTQMVFIRFPSHIISRSFELHTLM